MKRRELIRDIRIVDDGSDQQTVSVGTRYGSVEVKESSEGLIIDVWAKGYDEVLFSIAIDWDELDPECRVLSPE